MIKDVREMNHKRVYKCKLCHNMNSNSYVCYKCRSLLCKRKDDERRCVMCNCRLVNRSAMALRCRDCSRRVEDLRRSLRFKLQRNLDTINTLEAGKGDRVGVEQRIENLKLYRQKLLLRLDSTSVYKQK